eukprot:365747-Chlamydomonas_euryale.AAC.49
MAVWGNMIMTMSGAHKTDATKDKAVLQYNCRACIDRTCNVQLLQQPLVSVLSWCVGEPGCKGVGWSRSSSRPHPSFNRRLRGFPASPATIASCLLVELRAIFTDTARHKVGTWPFGRCGVAFGRGATQPWTCGCGRSRMSPPEARAARRILRFNAIAAPSCEQAALKVGLPCSCTKHAGRACTRDAHAPETHVETFSSIDPHMHACDAQQCGDP